MPTEQEPGRGAGLRQEARRDWQPEGADESLLQAGASADMSSTSSTTVALSVSLA